MVLTAPPAKMTCLCAPTKHAGSFRCRLHRSQMEWGGRPMPASPPKTEGVAVARSVVESRTSLMPERVLKPIVSLPAPPPKSLARSPPRGASRLNRMAVASHSEATEASKLLANEEHISPVKMATGTGARFAASSGLRPLVFLMNKNGHDRAKACS